MYRFMESQGFPDYDALHRWSIDEPTAFWPALARFCGLEFDGAPGHVLTQPGDMTTRGCNFACGQFDSGHQYQTDAAHHPRGDGRGGKKEHRPSSAGLLRRRAAGLVPV
jgi:hypothetical protein